jgi:hypothetical protein
MSHKAAFSLAAALIIGIASLCTFSDDASARGGRGGGARAGGAHAGGARVHHGGAYHGGAYRGAAVRRGVAVGAGAAAVGAYGAYGAYGGSACGYHPYPPCY